MHRFLVVSLLSLMPSVIAFSETYFEKAERAFNNASKMTLAELPEFPEYRLADCVVKRFPNRVNQNSFKIIKTEDAVLGLSARITIDDSNFTLSDMADGDLGNIDISSGGHVLRKNTIRILKSTNKTTFIFQEIQPEGNEWFATYCWW